MKRGRVKTRNMIILALNARIKLKINYERREKGPSLFHLKSLRHRFGP